MPHVPPETALVGAYDYRLVALSIVISLLASYAALDLVGRVTASRGRIRLQWLAGGAFTMGLGIWAMHYIGMLAWTLPVPVFYDWPTVVVSLLAAVLASGVALFVVSRDAMGPVSAGIGGLFMGIGIAGMHYIGMEAMRLPAMCRYSAPLVVLSVILAIVISLVALWLAFYCRDETRVTARRKLSSAVVMGAAIPVMHYTGMAAVTFIPMAMDGSLTHAVAITSLGTVVISSVTLIILGLTVLTVRIDRGFSAQASEMQRLMEGIRRQERLDEVVALRTSELAEAHARLTILDGAKNGFLQIISREFRKPPNPIEADMMERSRQKMVSVLDDALLLTQIDVDGEKFKAASISLKLVLDRAMERTRPFADARGVKLQPIPADLGQVRGEEDLLVRCFHALFKTAVRFSEKGVTVRIAHKAAPGSLQLMIESLGSTIPNQAIAKFFDISSVYDAISLGEDLGLSPPVASSILSLFGSRVMVANCDPPGIRLTVEFEGPRLLHR